MTNEATPREVGLSEGLGAGYGATAELLRERAFTHGGDALLYEAAEEIRALRTANAKLREAAKYAAYQLEKARIWGGMEWHYNPLHPLYYRSALERLRDVLRA